MIPMIPSLLDQGVRVDYRNIKTQEGKVLGHLQLKRGTLYDMFQKRELVICRIEE